MKNKRVYLLALLLTALAVSLAALKVQYGGTAVIPDYNPNLWRVNIIMNIQGTDARAKVRLTLPRDNPRQSIYNEHFENSEMTFYIRDREKTGNRIGFWRTDLLQGFKNLQYTFSAQLKKRDYVLPPNAVVPRDRVYPPEVQPQINLQPSTHIQSDEVKPLLKKIVKREKNAVEISRRIYDFVRGNVKYKSEKGSKDASATLDKLVADCGGQARLFVALSRAAGIPSRIVGGLLLETGIKNTTHVWAENYIGGEWIPFDVVNDNFGRLPERYLEL